MNDQFAETKSLQIPRVISGDIRIRPFQDADSAKVQELYMLAMAYGPDSPLRNALQTQLFLPITVAAYALFGAGLAIALFSVRWRQIGSLLSSTVTILFFGHRWLLSKSFFDFYEVAMRGDLGQIVGHYQLCPDDSDEYNLKPSTASGFWVAEFRKPNASAMNDFEIVGCVGLDQSAEYERPTCELRRMVVSPKFRRRGIAARLIQALLMHAQQHKVNSILLTVNNHQNAARQMYEQLGWRLESKETIKELIIIKLDLFHYRLNLTT